MSLAFFHLDHEWRKRRWKPYLSQIVRHRHVSSLNVEMTFGMGKSIVGWCPSTKHLVKLMHLFFEIPWQNFIAKLVSNWTKTNSSNLAFWNLEQQGMKKLRLQKVPKLEIKTIKRCGLINHLWKHSMLFLNKKKLDFLMNFPRLTFDIRKVASSLAIFTWLYLTSIKMLKGTIGLTMVSTNLWFYLCLISLPILLINAWMLPWMKEKKS